jgi:hypothetical protein
MNGILNMNSYNIENVGNLLATGNLISNGYVNASIYYDRDNSAYYLDPASPVNSLLVAGNVGIGTTSPSQKLTVAGNIGIQAGTNAFIGTLDNYALSLRTNNADRVFITNTGNVGIGTTSPTATLHISSTNPAGAINIVNTTTGASLLFVNATTGNVGIGQLHLMLN